MTKAAKWTGIGLVSLLALVGLVSLFREPAPPNNVAAEVKTRETPDQVAADFKVAASDGEIASAAAKAAARTASVQGDQDLAIAMGNDTIQALRAQLRDPGSAEFGPVWAASRKVDGKMATFICGSVNARNGFDGYTGAMHFVGFGPYVTTPEDAGFEGTWATTCAIGRKVADINP